MSKHEDFMAERKQYFDDLEKRLGNELNPHKHVPATDEQKLRDTSPLPVPIKPESDGLPSAADLDAVAAEANAAEGDGA